MRPAQVSIRVESDGHDITWFDVIPRRLDNARMPRSLTLLAIVARRLLPLATLFVLAACGRMQAPPALPDLIDKVMPSVVQISASPTDDGADARPSGRSLGSGLIWSADGYIVTNLHVIDGASEILVQLHDRRQLKARRVGVDVATDLALLKIEASELPAVEMANLDQLRVGEPLIAVGAAFGLDPSVTSGILSAKGRIFEAEQQVPYLQTDAAIHPGNSGGPLFNGWGQVVGVNTQMLTRDRRASAGVAFAIPADVVQRVAEQLRDHGSVRRAWLGVVVRGVTPELAERLGLPDTGGGWVSQVTAESPAAESGLRVGDVVLAINGKPLSTSRDLPPMIGLLDPGSMAQLSLARDGRFIEITVELAEAEPASGVPSLPPPPLWARDVPATPAPTLSSRPGSNRLGIQVAPLDAAERQSIPLMSGGVRISSVDEGPAIRAGLRVGDLLLQVNGQSVNSPERFAQVVARLTPEASVPVLVQRRGSPLFLNIDVPRNP